MSVEWLTYRTVTYRKKYECLTEDSWPQTTVEFALTLFTQVKKGKIRETVWDFVKANRSVLLDINGNLMSLKFWLNRKFTLHRSHMDQGQPQKDLTIFA